MLEGFKSYGATVIGSKQTKRGLPNQDAFGFETLDNGIQILAVSDGHGGALYIHSDRGAALAIEVSIEVCSAYFRKWSQEMHHETVRIQIEESLTRRIHEEWIKRVNEEPEFKDVIEYGCTLLVLICVEDRIYMMQLGDGKMAVVYEDGVVFYPVPRDEYSASNMTRSLSSGRAWLEMKVADIPMETSIHMIALATDGVENAYPNDYYDDASFFLNLANVAQDDLSKVLPEMLSHASCFSKDDCTVALLKNLNNQMVLSESMLATPMILFSEHALPYRNFTDLASEPLNTRFEMAVRLVDALAERKWEVPSKLTLKGLYYDTSIHAVDWLSIGPFHVLEVERLKEWLSMWLNCDIEFTELSEAKQALAFYQKRLRFDYYTQHFYFSESDDEHSLSLRGQFGSIELFHNTNLFLHQLMPIKTHVNRHVASVIRHEKNPDIWGLVNHTNHTWTVVGGNQTSIAPNKTLTLRKDIAVYIYGLPMRIEYR